MRQAVRLAVRLAVQRTVQPAVQRAVQLAEQPSVQKAVQLAVQQAVQQAVQLAVQPAEQLAAQLAVPRGTSQVGRLVKIQRPRLHPETQPDHYLVLCQQPQHSVGMDRRAPYLSRTRHKKQMCILSLCKDLVFRFL